MATVSKPKRRYTDEERSNTLAALAANSGNISATVRQVGIPAATIRAWSKGYRHPEAAQMCEAKKLPLADAFQNLAEKCVGLATERYAEMSPKDMIVTAAVCVDKMQLLRGAPTGINANVNLNLRTLSDAELDERIALALGRESPPGESESRVGTDGSGSREVPPALGQGSTPPL